MKRLIGKKITGLRVNDYQSILVFDTDAGAVGFQTFGDCCSETWFADITGVAALIGGTVQAVEEVSMDGYNVDDGRGRQEYDAAYGYKLTTDKGYADIVFRNSSNGHYGGDIEPLRGNPPDGMLEINDDWQA